MGYKINQSLIDDIKKRLLESSFDMEKKPEGTIHFFVREGTVQKRFEEEEINIVQMGQVNEDAGKTKPHGVSLKGISNLIKLIANALSSVERVIEHGDIYIYYSVQEDGVNFNSVNARIVTPHHYATKKVHN
ncbi:hypothetical protein P9597_09270 [Aneurinibacillus migulanus]|uniref:hypothetical protein n=1 Tax=Aneurinibacillus migulanus TaxID=47500 RepID=UPI002E1CEC67|nr:hypothetical protein [Aneurinibacillus migulanus]